MKRKLILPLCAMLMSLALLLCSCSKGSVETTVTAAVTPHDDEKSYSVAILQFDNDYASNLIRQAFIARMRTLGYDEAKMKFDVLSSQANTDTLTKNAESLVGSEYSLIVAVGTLAAKAVSLTGNGIPCVFIAADDPVENSLVSDLIAPDGNMTGTAHVSSPEELMSVMRVYTPVTSVAVLYNLDSPSSKAEAERVRDTLSENAYTVSLTAVGPTDNIDERVAELSPNTDAFYFTNDEALLKKSSQAVRTAAENGKPVFTSSESLIAEGALMGAFTGSEELAREAALICDRIMQGEDIRSISVKTDVDISLFVSSGAMNVFEIEKPVHDRLVTVTP